MGEMIKKRQAEILAAERAVGEDRLEPGTADRAGARRAGSVPPTDEDSRVATIEAKFGEA